MAGGALEMKVISEILRQKNFYPAIKQGLNYEHFSDAEAARIFEMIRLQYMSRDAPKSFPSLREIRSRYPGFQMVKAGEEDGELSTLVKELKYRCLSSDLESMARTIQEIVSENEPEEALEFLRSQMGTIKHQFSGSQGMRMSDAIRSVREQYGTALGGGAYGIPWPFQCLTEDTMGKRSGDLIFIYGRAKSMKTWVALKSAIHDYEESKSRVFFWSREMQWPQLSLRIGSIVARVDYQLLKRGILPPPVWERAQERLEGLYHVFDRSASEKKQRRDRNEDDLMVFSGRHAPREFEELRAAVDEAEPDVIYLDSFYHLIPTRGGKSDHERIRYLIEDMKQLALDVERPVILVHQANREGEKTFGDTMTDFARSDAAAAECDLALKVIRKKVGEIYEEDYEGFWEQQGSTQTVKRKRRGIKMNVTKDLVVRNDETMVTAEKPNYERTKAELALMLSGSRDGVLDGFVISANPGYEFEVIDDNVNAKDVKRWLQNESELADKEEGREKSWIRDEQKQQRESFPRNPGAAKGLRRTTVRPKR